MIRKLFLIAMLLSVTGLLRPSAPIHAQNVACEGAPPSRLFIGARAAIIPIQEGVDAVKVRVRQQPGLKGVVVTQLQTGAQMTVTDGPQCADGYLWWVVQLDDGLKGWAAEGTKQNYFLDPIKAALVNCPDTPPTRFVVGARGQVRPARAGAIPNVARVRDAASTKGKLLLNLAEKISFTVLEGPECQEKYVWWKVRVDGNATGWIAEGDLTNGYYILPTGYTRAALVDATPTPGAQPTPVDAVTEVLGFYRAYLSPNDQYIAGILTDETIKVWDAATGKPLWEFKPELSFLALTFSPDSKSILFGDRAGNVQIFDLATKERTRRIELSANVATPVSDLVFSRDNTWLAVDHEGGNTQIVNYADGKIVREIIETQRVTISGMGFSPDGKRIVTGGSDASPTVWNVETGEKLFRLEGHSDLICGLTWSADGKIIVSASLDTSIRVWDATTGQPLRTFTPTSPRSTSITLTMSRDSKRVAVAHNDSITRVWDVATGQEKVQFIGQFTHITAAAFNSDGSQVLTAGKDGTARLWNVADASEVRRFLAK